MARIFLVEDEAVIRMILREELSDLGHVVIEAGSGDDALRLVEAGVTFDLLLTDIQMPGAVDGVTLSRRLRETDAALPVIFVTGRPEALSQAGTLGVWDAVVRKPFSAPEVVTLVAQMLQRRAIV